MTKQPAQKVYAVLSKGYTEDRYSVWEKVDKEIDARKQCLAEEIADLIVK